MLMTIHIDPAVQANVDLSPDQSNHINLEGGGDLSFQYTPQGDMFLNGRYTLSGGTIKYSIPVIPLKEFNVQEGSYVQWTGNPMDPTLNLTATERVRTSVTLTGQSSPRLVNFDVGIELTQQLENLGLQFTLTAPEDMAMQEELTSKGPEERAKLAVSMLVTGMYLGRHGPFAGPPPPLRSAARRHARRPDPLFLHGADPHRVPTPDAHRPDRHAVVRLTRPRAGIQAATSLWNES